MSASRHVNERSSLATWAARGRGVACATAQRAYFFAVGVISVARFSTATLEPGKVIAVATQYGDWHWKRMPCPAYSTASARVKFST